jgi:hypothetical protein
MTQASHANCEQTRVHYGQIFCFHNAQCFGKEVLIVLFQPLQEIISLLPLTSELELIGLQI